jgi:hypothetical protein
MRRVKETGGKERKGIRNQERGAKITNTHAHKQKDNEEKSKKQPQLLEEGEAEVASIRQARQPWGQMGNPSHRRNHNSCKP